MDKYSVLLSPVKAVIAPATNNKTFGFMQCLLKNKKLDKFHFYFHFVNRFLVYILYHTLSSEI